MGAAGKPHGKFRDSLICLSPFWKERGMVGPRFRVHLFFYSTNLNGTNEATPLSKTDGTNTP